MDRPPYQRGVEAGTPRIGGTHNGVGLAIIGQILAAHIKGEVAEFTRHLQVKLGVSGEIVARHQHTVGIDIGRHTARTVELQREIQKLKIR